MPSRNRSPGRATSSRIETASGGRIWGLLVDLSWGRRRWRWSGSGCYRHQARLIRISRKVREAAAVGLVLAVLASSKTIRLLPGLASCARADSCQCRGSTATAPMPQSRGYQNCTRRPLGLEVAREARQPETLVPSKGDDHFTWKPRHKLRYISALFDRCGRHSARTTFKPYSCPRLLASPNRQGSLEARFSSSPHAVRDRRLKESLSL